MLEYIINEAKNERLSKKDAVLLIRKLQNTNHTPGKEPANISAKPSSISLCCPQESQKPLSEPLQRHQQSITLSSTADSLKKRTEISHQKKEKDEKNTIYLKTLQKELSASAAKILYMEKSKVEINKNFTDMGMDSIICVEWIKVINKRYGTTITASKLYDHPSIREFAEFLLNQLNGNGDQRTSEKSEMIECTAEVEPSPASHLIGKLKGKGHSVTVPDQARFEDHTERQPAINQEPGQKQRTITCDRRGRKRDDKAGIAIIGMSGRYSGAKNLEEYWDILVNAKSAIREIPYDRWNMDTYQGASASKNGKINCRWMGALDDIAYFDPLFFNISETEAEIMDPQHRIFMQEGYKAFEDAGLTRTSLSKKKCGVYLGIMNNEYGQMLFHNQPERMNTTGNSYAIAAARLPYFLNLKGSAISIDTACSSSLVATHLACRALSASEIDIALVGGVSLYLTPESYAGMCAAGMLSSDGKCKAFDQRANGFVPGEGVGALVLKRLKDAEADNDIVYGVIIGSGTNQNGKTNGITAPNRNSQIELEREVYDKYNIHPESITYAEMHGTGTRLGDLFELEALSTVFKEKTDKKRFCAVSSVKPNIGHTSAASGIAGIQKILLSMKYKKIAPTINFSRPNESFNFDDSPFFVNTAPRPWETPPSKPRRAGASSFGFSGTNAHIVLEEYIQESGPKGKAVKVNADNPALFVLSAKRREQLRAYAQIVRDWIESHQELDIEDIAYTFQVGREAMDYRLAIPAEDMETLIKRLTGFIEEKSDAGVMTHHADSMEIYDADEASLSQLLQNKDIHKLAEMWVKGLKVDWNLLYGDKKPRRCSMPTYPFARESYWISEKNNAAGRLTDGEIVDTEKIEDRKGNIAEVYAYDEPYLKDHTVFGEQVLIGVTHGSLALNVFFKLFPLEDAVLLHRLIFVEPIEIRKDQKIEVVPGAIQKGPVIDFKAWYSSKKSETWNLTATGTLQNTRFENKQINIEDIKKSFEEIKNIDRIYSSNPAVQLGDSFKTISLLYKGKDQVLAKVALTKTSLMEKHFYVLHPLILNSAFQAVVPLMGEMNEFGFLPLGIKDIYFHKSDSLDHCWLSVKLEKNSGEVIVFNADIINDQSQVVCTLKGCSIKRLRSKGINTKKDGNGDGLNPTQPESNMSKPEAINTHSEKDLSIQIQNYLTHKIRKITAGPSKLSNLEANLMDLGLESSQLIAVAGEIEKELSIELFPTLFFEYPNIRELTEYFVRTHKESFARLFGVESKQTVSLDGAEQFFHRDKVDKIQRCRSNAQSPALSQGNSSFELHRDNIAVIGMHGLFPQATSLDRFWQNLVERKNVIKEIPVDHWDYRPWYDPDPKATDKTYCKWGSFIDGVDQFDAGFFNISPREAEWMDPQLRLLLQSIYAAGEDAGCINQLRGTSTGVFIGVCCHDYADKIAEMNIAVDPYLGTGNAQTVIANRVSFLFDLTGPSMAVDTACSSSLFALHYACHALRKQECDMAFVGGVNLLLSSWHYRYFSSIGALSPTGRCLPFDAAADGYVPGECIASILLKSLRQAKKDGDQIYCVIKGSAALHGGYTPSFTAPSVAGEENVIVKAWQDARIEPETISYIETHGTGTKLGDPIEINSLKKAFQRFTGKERFCAIGSVKANIGHTEGAAGIAAIIKVILQMKSRQIPALPRLEQLNPYIQLDRSALYINRECAEWKNTEDVPLRAGISSFGMSGAYAHVVIEDYVNAENTRAAVANTPENQAIIVLSARNKERLEERVQQLLFSLKDRQFTDKDLGDIAYTLQVGREAMEERMAALAGSITELVETLENYLDGRKHVPGCCLGQAKQHAETLSVFAADEDMTQIIETWIRKRKYTKLMELWVRGFTFDWNSLYGESKPRRISLPTYPFAGERYWITHSGNPSAGTPAATSESSANIHPLLHRNTSDFTEQRFSSAFTGDEFFLADHNVRGRRVLPGVAYLEMARAAVFQACGAPAEGDAKVKLEKVVWVQPIVAGEKPVQVHIGLHPKDSGEIAYEIYSFSGEDDAETVLHNQGIAIVSSPDGVQPLDLNALQAECSRESLGSMQCYEAFRAMAIDYGPAHRGLEKVFVGQDRVLAKLSLPPSISGTQDRFILHPSMMDSALQAFIGLMLVSDDSTVSESPPLLKPVLPFALEELEIYGRCRDVMWALVRSNNGHSAGDKAPELEIDLCDDIGRVQVRMRGLTSRVLEGEILSGKIPHAEPLPASDEPHDENTMLTPVWNPIAVEKGINSPSADDKIVIVGGTGKYRRNIKQYYPKAYTLKIRSQDSQDDIAKKLQAHGPIDHVIWIASHEPLADLGDDVCIKEQNNGVLQVFRMIKALLSLGYGTRNLGWTLVTIQAQPVYRSEPVHPTHAGLHGLIGSTAKEYSNWKTRLVDLEADCDWPFDEIFSLPADPEGNAWGYRGGQWYRQQLIPIQLPGVSHTRYKEGGVYVVVGGAGGIGEAWSEYMIRRYQAQTVWIGRREKDEAIQAKLDRLAGLGPAPHYIAADGTDQQAFFEAFKEIKKRYSKINGVIHAAIVLMDKSLANMQEEEFRAGLAAKVDVAVCMARAFKDEPLDFVMYFNSIQAFTKSPGQSNYASGCTFKDAFAHQLSRQWPCAVKVMNWGYWGGVGVVASQTYQERMARMGIGSIDPPEAMDALETLLAGPLDQMVLIKTTRPAAALKGIHTGEWITVYPENVTSVIRKVKERIPQPVKEIHPIRSQLEPHAGEIDRFLCRLLWGQLQSMGLFEKKTTAMPVLKVRAGRGDWYHKWFDETIAVLNRYDYLLYDGQTCTVTAEAAVDMDAAWKEWDRKKNAWFETPGLKAQVVLAEAMLRALPAILTGEVRATDIMFPDSTMELVQGIYQNNPVMDYFNGVLADTLTGYVQERLEQDSTAKIRILEIGAGTGGTSAMVLRKLTPYRNHIREYCYTDISNAFLQHAEKTYGPQNPYLTYRIFNVEAPIDGQNIGAGRYDAVIAANVLHATGNIRRTLRHAKAALIKNGLLLLNEISTKVLFAHLTFGLLEGWWKYEDTALRIPGCPGISSEAWQRVLESEGFSPVIFPVPQAHDMGQQIIAAESDGVVRQKKSPKPGNSYERRRAKAKAGEKQISISKPETPAEEVTQELLQEKCIAVIKKLVSETLKFPVHKIDSSEPLEKYGLDSILAVQLTNNLNKLIDGVNSTLFFEYQTIDALVRHFLETRKEALPALAGIIDKEIDDHAVSTENEASGEPPPAQGMRSFETAGRFLRLCRPEIEKPEQEPARVRDIAVIGLCGRYPAAKNIHEFWENLKSGKDCITEIPADRWDHNLFFDEEKGKPGKTYCRWGGFIDGVDRFDPLFFNISPREAEIMDPMGRLFLETVWDLMENAGYTREALERQCQSKIGVYVGAMFHQYPFFDSDAAKASAISVSSYSAIANRVSHYFNFKGPSVAIDTMCSSSAMAVHMACESLMRGDCKIAIAGGVNLSIHPKKYIGLSQAQLLGSHLNSRSFGDGDGYLPAESVGAVLLKPLSQAIDDRDSIWAVIKSTTTNHGGHTNGFTVPNPEAQAQLIIDNFEKSEINPRSISYVEAAATGSALADAIEFAGLNKAFQKFTTEQQFCGIGSVKSNIGHPEAASGIAQLTKVILQLHYQQLVPSIKADPLNPGIHFDPTPFYMQRELKRWERPVAGINGREHEFPRRAAISSFGAAGSNTHLIVEEYTSNQGPQANKTSTSRPQIVVFSAKNTERLQAVIERMGGYLEERKEIFLPDLAYTLQVGREAMEARAAMVVKSPAELRQGLMEYQELMQEKKGTKTTIPIFTENLREEQTGSKALLSGRVGQTVIQTLLAENNLEKIALHWANGGKIPWESLHAGKAARRISLPTYPFKRERYWVTEPENTTAGMPSKLSATGDAIHPLLQKNTSDLLEQRFSSTFTGREFFLMDHMVKGRKILPGVACLEMARAAVAQSARTFADGRNVIRLEKIVWVHPLVVTDQAVQVHIGLMVGENKEIAFEIYSDSEVENMARMIHCRGSAVIDKAEKIQPFNIEELKAQCNQAPLDGGTCYESFGAVGLNLGKSFQGVEAIYVGKERALGKLSLPSNVFDELDKYVLHPGMMDSSLHVSLGLMLSPDKNDNPGVKVLDKLSIPFTLKEIEILGKCTANMWSFVRSEDGGKAGDGAWNFDIDVCDGQGNVCIRMRGFSARALESEGDTKAKKTTSRNLGKCEDDELTAVSGIKENGALIEKVQSALARTVSDLLKIRLEDIRITVEMFEYGFDSTTFIEFAKVLNRKYQLELAPPVFFEYPSIKSLAEYLVNEHRTAFERQFGDPAPSEVPAKLTNDAVEPIKIPGRPLSRFSRKSASYPTTKAPVASENIAIVGMSGRLPMAEDLDQFWENLVEGRDCITEIPIDRWDWKAYFGDPAIKAGKTDIKWGGFIDGVDEFDPYFFGISPREAELMDPQQRLLMAYVWKAIEDAGYSAKSLSGTKTAIFIGTGDTGYSKLISEAKVEIDGYSATGMVPSVGPNRMSYFLNIHGPSEPVETACSSSLVAIHRAVGAIENGTCEMAIVGGVNTILIPEYHIGFSKAGMLSKKGRCRPFSDKADGYVRGEGVGILVLKELKKAEEDGNHIYGIIKGTAENHGGRAKSLTAPNPKAQAELIKTAYAKAGIDPGTVSYIEAHGTGTKLGDPIEINGLKSAFEEICRNGEDTKAMKAWCGLGSVKSNIGHLELAAGIAGVIKVLLQIKNRMLVKSLHCDTINPYIQLDDSPFYIVQEARKWTALKDDSGNLVPRRAGVSSYGFGGSNAHVVIEEYVARKRRRDPAAREKQPPAIIVLSAKGEEQLKQQAQQLEAAIRARKFTDTDLADIAYTLQAGREAMEMRMGLIAGSIKELGEKLEGFIAGREGIENLFAGKVKRNRETLAVLNADEDMTGIIENWASKGKFAKILSLWVAGLNLDWNALYGKDKPMRISLPTYPFERSHYWVPMQENKIDTGRKAASSAKASIHYEDPVQYEARPLNRAMKCLQKQWERCSADSNREFHRNIAVLSTRETRELASRLVENLRHSQILDIEDPSIISEGAEPVWKNYDGCIDLTGCGSEKHTSLDWIEWPRQLIEKGHKEGLMLLCVTRGLESYKNETVNLSGAARAGLFRMLQSEYHHLRTRHMDTDLELNDEALARQIIDEFHMDNDDPEVCYRDGNRYRAVLLETDAFDSGLKTLKFPDEHVLWITGGTRGLGYLCAEHFIKRHGVKRLVLTGRDIMPPREQWDVYDENKRITLKIQAVQALEEQGVQVRVMSVPLTEHDDLRQRLNEITSSMGPIGGIIHCAGLSDPENPAFIRKSVHSIAEVLEPKMAGLEIMYRIFKNQPLQFFVLFSSVSAIIPTLAAGQSDYAMANAYMDYFAEAKNSVCPIVSIEWPNWKETGMGEIKSKAYQRTGLLGHTNLEGLKLLDQILACKPGPVVLPAVVDPHLWRPHRLMQRIIGKDDTANLDKPPRRSVKAAPAEDALRKKTLDWLISLFIKELKMDPGKLEPDMSFQDYGMDSILLAQVITKIDRKLKNIKLDPTIFLENPTLQRLSDFMTKTCSEALTSLFSMNRSRDENMEMSLIGSSMQSPVSKNDVRKQANRGMPPSRKKKIAIVGMACHFPDARNLKEFWRNLRSGKDSIREVPTSRWDWQGFYSADPDNDGKTISKWGAFIDGIEDFDPDYFKIDASLAAQIDPLQRQWLEVSTEALADGGYNKKDLWGKRVGVFAGSRTGNFISMLGRNGKSWIAGVGQNFIAVHLAHVFNFKGPNMVVDTACASALTAVHLAVRCIQNGEAEMAVAGGVDILLDEHIFLLLSAAKLLSPDGRCKAFDADASGIGLGEGCGVLVLKPLQDAIEDHNKIYGVIDGSAVNSDGNTMGVTTPNPDAQQELIDTVLIDADINPETITYVETHGTGTLIGDPIELRALTRVFEKHTEKKQFCGVGSVKSNFGHLLSAAGVAGMIKVLLSITGHELPPTLHCTTPNPRFNFDKSPFYPVLKVKKWTTENQILRAGISAFGLGGNNAHLILSNEGVPKTHSASIEPKGGRIIFNRKRYWPEKTTGNEKNNYPPGTGHPAENDEDSVFNKFFEIEEV